ncbi:hypothetical protein OOK60_06880 [Trichothermofontia sichuanensis B231]|uniref:hypothetical protein n=1 Tax=Trichothermofontia sichuanensis TaxID=3045816 RepID=UPI0022481C62|nr:hypothetical protein [Trichothermofontia sichuanensis]UZQ55789.1 hypothetical protein OOK60_06880 [Trichothermofontia sichuanensis B231]
MSASPASPPHPSTLPDSPTPVVFRISPLIRLTLLGFYLALTLPLPFLSQMTQAPVPPWLLGSSLALGWVGLYAALSDRVTVNSEGVRLSYAPWVPSRWRSGWFLPWDAIVAIKPRSTGQGGLVYYFLSRDQQAYLLPMHIAGFSRFLQLVEQYTDLDTRDIRPLAQPWMYGILLILTLLLLLIDIWTLSPLSHP